jgi:hypothetical protein
MRTLHPFHPRTPYLVPLWVAVVSGLAGVLFVIAAGGVFTLLGGPVTVSFGAPDQAVQPFVPASQASALPPPFVPPVTSAPATPVRTPSPAGPTPTAKPVVADQPPTYLKNLDTPTGRTYQVSPQTMSGQRYEEAFKLYCRATDASSDRTSWTVSGFSRFTAVIGIADDQGSALNIVARVSIQNQDGGNLLTPFEVSLGQPHRVDIAITGIVQLQVFASCRNGPTGRPENSYLTLGDAALR